MNYAGLKDTVGSGVRIDGDIYDPDTRDEYLKKLLELMGDEEKWKEEQKKGIEFAKSFTWDKISSMWLEQFI